MRALGRLRTKLPELQEALDGRMPAHHRTWLKHILAHLDFSEHSLEALQQDSEERLPPFEDALLVLRSIPGMQAIAAAAILAEIGEDMTRFPSDKHLARFRWALPWEQAKWRETAQREDNERECPGESHLDRSRLGSLS